MAASAAASLDVFDLKILRLLQIDASLSLEQIASQVGLSHSPCWRRIKRMEEHKVIRGRVALVDPDAMDLNTTVLISVRLSDHSSAARERFDAAVRRRPEIVECYSVFGADDYILKVVAPSVSQFDTIFKETILSLPHLDSARSMVALKRVKSTTALPI